ncbi:hypothetical protein [Epilithonimonas hungarica]|uniref:DUF4013 domain-containing protein n=1 Tax=Epilithonimonas hungarica TaxID=454006 RepID=A0A1G7FSA8_9FLAO|nr:hypothetical protein [Epilithonimonas hungarica]SDE78754.1 hypothetical protein SAMN05421825_0202 [Epilithonimonas hungarica]
MSQLSPKPVQFKFGEYISQAIDLMKKDFGTIFLSFLCTIVLSIIPFCGLMAVGNFYKICYKIEKGIPTGAGEIFNFDDFVPYLIFQLYIFAGLILLFIPFGVFSITIDNDGMISGLARGIGMIFLAVVYFAILYVLLQAFYVPALITFKKITDIKTAWNISKIMTKGNLLTIFFFSIATAFLGELGIILCGIGIFLTLPFINVSHYFAFKDGLAQIEHDELTEIGKKY